MRRGTVFHALCVAAVLVGCATTPKPVVNEAITVEDVQYRILQSSRTLHDFFAEGSITVSTPTMDQSAGFEIATRGKDSVMMSVYGPFGITIGTALFTRNEFTAYNALNNTVYRGSPEKQMQMLPMVKEIPFELIISSLQGIHPFSASATIDSFSVNDGTTYSFTHSYDDGSFDRFIYHNDIRRITRCTRKNSAGTILWSVKYWYTYNSDSTIIPEQVEVSIPSKETTLLLEYGSVSNDTLSMNFTISYPDDAEIITLE